MTANEDKELQRVGEGQALPALRVGSGSIEALEGNPAKVIERASEIATHLMAIEKRAPQLVVTLGGRKHLRVEMWTTMGAMLKVFPHVVSDRPLADFEDETWEAVVELVHMPSGAVVSRASATASGCERIRRREDGELIPPPWANASFSIRSMAQTRAVGKAFRLAFSWIPVLAGYDPTPAEEMDGESAPRQAKPKCPECGSDAFYKAKDKPEWFCWKKKGGCGKSFGVGPDGLPVASAEPDESTGRAEAWGAYWGAVKAAGLRPASNAKADREAFSDWARRKLVEPALQCDVPQLTDLTVAEIRTAQAWLEAQRAKQELPEVEVAP